MCSIFGIFDIKEHNGFDSAELDYQIDGTIVRGLDYYTKTVFEFKTTLEGAAGTVCGGGSYDGLIEELGGSPTPGIGFAMGIERIILALEKSGAMPEFTGGTDVFIANIGEETELFVTALTDALRRKKISCDRDHMGRSLKAQMKYADKCGARFSIVIGGDEATNKRAVLKNMRTKETIEVSLENTEDIVKAVMEDK